MIREPLKQMPWTFKAHIKSLVGWLLSEVCFAGGDGDATWVVKNIELEQLREFVIDECLSASEARYWTVHEIRIDEHGSRFSLANNQEALVFTTTERDVPPWSQCTVTL
jgi:hypothetical protein